MLFVATVVVTDADTDAISAVNVYVVVNAVVLTTVAFVLNAVVVVSAGDVYVVFAANSAVVSALVVTAVVASAIVRTFHRISFY